MNVDDFIKKCRELEAKATSGPWEVLRAKAKNRSTQIGFKPNPIPQNRGPIADSAAITVCRSTQINHEDTDDFTFIIFSRNNWLTLIDKLEKGVEVIKIIANLTEDHEICKASDEAYKFLGWLDEAR